MKNKNVIGVIGIILAVLGVVGTFSLTSRDPPFLYASVITGLLVIIGIILIAWSFSD